MFYITTISNLAGASEIAKTMHTIYMVNIKMAKYHWQLNETNFATVGNTNETKD